MTILFGWAAKLVGERFAKPFTWIIVAVLLLGIVFLLGRCTGNDDPTPQIEQTDRSTAAITGAAEGAIKALEERTVTEDAIDQAVQGAIADIGTAASPEAVEAVVIQSVCAKPSHRNDPGCRQ